jgi:starch phosphorylase
MLRRVSLVDEHGERRVRMAYLAVVASHSINGVSALHSQLMQQSIFAEFAQLWPARFNNKTNGITPRRWLAQANPALSDVLDKYIGTGWRRDLTQLGGLAPLAHQPALIKALQDAKRANKQRLADWVQTNMGLQLPVHAMFDVQVKRIHEYKRQLLNVLHVIARYQRILRAPQADMVPRVVIFAGKAASAYHMAKLIIQLINDLATTINNDPRVGDKLKVVFIPNYSVSLAERIIPAADLSEQISTAGTEASGTGNMKLALNGALTIGTLDGANVEILDGVGEDNIFIFGLTAPEVAATRAAGYQAAEALKNCPELQEVLLAIRDGFCNPDEPQRYQSIYDALVNWGDHYLLLADYPGYAAAQDAADAAYRNPDAWTLKTLHNIAAMGPFSADRTIEQYAREIWKTKPVSV